MIQQLILNTLMACHPKSEGVVVSSVKVQSEPEVQTDSSSASPENSTSNSAEVISTESVPTAKEPSWPDSLPKPVGLDTLPPIKPTSIPLRTFSSPVLLSNLSYYDIRFYDQPEDDPYQFVCVRMCESNPMLASHQSLSGIENCQMDLIENWKEVVGAVQEQGREELLPQLEVQVGVVECNGDVVYIMKGRAATTPAQYETLEDDWGGYFARLAQEEATAVFAFTELLDHLQDWEAPSSLQDWCGRIIEEEKVHTLMMSGLAHRNGQQSAVVHFPEVNRVSMKEMAIHNALTGCIGETWSAVELCHQAEHAPKYNGVFKRIAKDETSHAEFSWALHEWLMSQLTEDEQTEVLEAMREMLRTPPEVKSFGAVAMGEMTDETTNRSWNVFSSQIEQMLVRGDRRCTEVVHSRN